MKLGRIKMLTPDGDQARIVAVEPQADRVIDLARAYAAVLKRRGATDDAAVGVARTLFPSSMSRALANGELFREAAEVALGAADDASTALDSVSWVAAVDPPVIRDSLTYPVHMKNFLDKINAGPPSPHYFKTPPYFKGSVSRVYGHGEEVPYPSYTDFLDWEFEIGIIVGGSGHNLTLGQGADRIFGYTIFNDFSARDVQPAEITMGMGPQKSKDFAFGIGPWITTADEIPSVEELTGTIRLNGELISRVEAAGAVFSPAELVAWVSVADNVLPGDLIATGTLGFGSGLEIDTRLRPGDALELELDGVGALRTTIGDPDVAPWRPAEKPYPWSTQNEEETVA